LGLPVQKAYGGRNLDILAYVDALAEIAREGTGIRTFFSGHTSLGQKTVQAFGSETLKKTYLLPSTKGKVIFAFALTEPEAGSDPLSLKMTYRERKGHYVLNGIKYLISNSGIADAMIVFARTKQATDELAEKLQARGFSAAAINGDVVQAQRERTIQQLKDGKIELKWRRDKQATLVPLYGAAEHVARLVAEAKQQSA